MAARVARVVCESLRSSQAGGVWRATVSVASDLPSKDTPRARDDCVSFMARGGRTPAWSLEVNRGQVSAST
eukprot:8703607-Lingulodinium_polyedra.AAC.1